MYSLFCETHVDVIGAWVSSLEEAFRVAEFISRTRPLVQVSVFSVEQGAPQPVVHLRFSVQ